jgi:hypothetical protein
MAGFTAFTLLLTLAATGVAQQQGPSADLATSIKSQYKQNQGFILASADKWPEDAYGWKPAGLETELRTFGQLLVHIANENNQQCSRVLGRPNPVASDDSKSAYTKAQAIKIVRESFAFCDPVFESLTNENMGDMLKMPGRGTSTMQRARATSLILDLTHSNEQYGMIMVYFAMKGMVPVSHEKK